MDTTQHECTPDAFLLKMCYYEDILTEKSYFFLEIRKTHADFLFVSHERKIHGAAVDSIKYIHLARIADC